MKVGFLGFDQFHGKKNIGSSRIQCDYPIKYWQQAGEEIGTAERYKLGVEYDAIIYQKAYWAEHAQNFGGIKILYICDPDWLHWAYPIKQTMDSVDAVCCSTEALREVLEPMFGKPVTVIPDRVDPDTAPPETKKHEGEAKSVVWYGYAENYPVLEQAIQAIIKRDLELIVVANKPFVPPSGLKKLKVTNLKWSPDTWLGDIMRGDIVINPKLSTGRFKYKSDNKTIQAWQLGMPVAYNEYDLDRFSPEKARIEEAEKRLQEVRELYDVKLSVIQLKGIIRDCRIAREATLQQQDVARAEVQN